MTHLARRYAVPALEEWISYVLKSSGVPTEHAGSAAQLLLRSDLRGYETHGIARLPTYVARLRAKEFNPTPAMRHSTSPGLVIFDSDGAMGHVAAPLAIDVGLQALQQHASVFVSLRDCGHLGALGIHVLRAAEAGAFCIAGQMTPPRLAMPGFSGAAIGHNPIAFACPVPRHEPIVFDVACSVAARGHIMKAAREGSAIPEGWAVDAEGNSTTIASAALEGNLLPMAGHKGLGIAMMIQCLAGMFGAPGPVSKAAATTEGAGGRQPGFFWLLAPNAANNGPAFQAMMHDWIAYFTKAGGAQARLPGLRGAALERTSRKSGIVLPPAVESELFSLGKNLNLSFPDPLLT
jgi:LDH2 family malate/lactate/ureidoglycolate dehydrogenase